MAALLSLSLVFPSVNPKSLTLNVPKVAPLSLPSSPSRSNGHCHVSASSAFLTLPRAPLAPRSRFVLNVAVSSELEEEEEEEEGEGEVLSDEAEPSFSPDLKLFVGNLPFSVDSAQLAGLFESAGNVEMVEV